MRRLLLSALFIVKRSPSGLGLGPMLFVLFISDIEGLLLPYSAAKTSSYHAIFETHIRYDLGERF